MKTAATVYVARGRAKPFWCGHPLVYSGAVARVDGAPQAGDWVRVCDHEGHEIGLGTFNPHSDYRVRLLSWAAEGSQDEDVMGFITRRLRAARAVRTMLELPSEECTVYRLLNSEGDRCSGLTVDCFHPAEEREQCVVVVVSSAYWVERYRTEICAALEAELKPTRVYWRQSRGPLQQDGWRKFEEQAEASERMVVKEHGLRYYVEPGAGQKTGFYCDQRENRLLVRRLARGRRVLDAFCYSGAFALNAAAGGAASVLGVDTSEAAVQLADENAKLNGFANVQFEKRAAESALAKGEYDMVILDPPKLAGSRAHVAKAVRLYRALCLEALRRLSAEGLLVVCSCSSALGAGELREALREAGVEAGRAVNVLSETHAAPDHPVPAAFPEGQYLTCLVCVAQ